jgi:hypothetical protein
MIYSINEFTESMTPRNRTTVHCVNGRVQGHHNELEHGHVRTHAPQHALALSHAPAVKHEQEHNMNMNMTVNMNIIDMNILNINIMNLNFSINITPIST